MDYCSGSHDVSNGTLEIFNDGSKLEGIFFKDSNDGSFSSKGQNLPKSGTVLVEYWNFGIFPEKL